MYAWIETQYKYWPCKRDACATHGVLSGPAIERIRDSVIDELVILDTISQPEEKLIDKILGY